MSTTECGGHGNWAVIVLVVVEICVPLFDNRFFPALEACQDWANPKPYGFESPEIRNRDGQQVRDEQDSRLHGEIV